MLAWTTHRIMLMSCLEISGDEMDEGILWSKCDKTNRDKFLIWIPPGEMTRIHLRVWDSQECEY